MPAARTITALVGAAACVALAAPALGHAAAHSRPATRSGRTSDAAVVHIRPGVKRLRGTRSAPMTTAQCVQNYGFKCYGAPQLERAYGTKLLNDHGTNGRGQTIAIVDPFGSPTMTRDLHRFDRAYGLPDTSITVVRPAGDFTWKANDTDEGWAGETTLDVEWAHVMAPAAKILLVETPTDEDEGSSGFPQIVKAEKYVVRHHLAGVISQSFGATEPTFPTAQSLLKLRGAYVDAAKHGVTVLAAGSDSGATDYTNGSSFYHHRAVDWPADDPLVTGLGGTRLNLDASGKRVSADAVWNDTYNTVLQQAFTGSSDPSPFAGGGGRSQVFARPGYQDDVRSVTHKQRGTPDISMSAACNGAVNTYQSYPGMPAGWGISCGDSEATPLFAGIVALCDQVAGHPLGLINPALYRMSARHAPGIVDVTSGNNTVSFTEGTKQFTVHGFKAGQGYDLASGVGTVYAPDFVPELARAAG